ncbi:DNA integrity scanning protein DisA [uncultured archaeon]|nr:DNA integrity scanning protein DisA [uncultured archaeon]
MLEKQKEIFSDLLSHLNVLEMNNLVMTSDICNVLQRMEIIKRISDVVKRYLIELGKEGTIISMRLKELTKNFSKDRDMILRDYFGAKFYRIDSALSEMSFDFLLENSNLSRTLFEELHDRPISPRGLRVMGKTSLLEKDVKVLLNHFNTLDKIFDSSKDDLLKVFKNEDLVDSLIGDLQSLREKILSGKRI